MGKMRIQESYTYICVFPFQHPNSLSSNPPLEQPWTSLLGVTILDFAGFACNTTRSP